MIELMLIKDVTEDELISIFLPHLPKAKDIVVASGDDSAVYPVGGETTVSTDLLIEDHHFKTEWSTGRDVGYRAAQQNLADAVAMGARPVSLVVGLGLPAELSTDWVVDFAKGLADACEPLGVGVDGGDLVAAEKITVSVTVIGDMEGRSPLLRSGAQLEDKIIFAGNLGHGIAGFHLLSDGVRRGDENEKLAGLVDDFLRPKPPLETALDAARTHKINSLMDVSDGLIRDGSRIARSSRVWLDFNENKLRPYLADIAIAAGRAKANRHEWVLTGGEDHGFLGTISKDAEIPAGFVEIGTVSGASKDGRVTVSGRDVADFSGWDHFHGSTGGGASQAGPGTPLTSEEAAGFGFETGGGEFGGSFGAAFGDGNSTEFGGGAAPFSTPL